MSERLISLLTAANIPNNHPLYSFLAAVAAEVGNGGGGGLDPDPPPAVSPTTSIAGGSLLGAHGDHTHAHGDLPGGLLHAAATRDPGGEPGFVSPADLSQLDANTASITTLQGQVATLQGQVATLQTDVANNTADIATLAGQVATLQIDVANNTADIATLAGQVANNTADIATLAGQVATLQGQVATLQTDVANNTADIATLAGQVATLQGQVATLQTDVANNTADIATLTAAIATLVPQTRTISTTAPLTGGGDLSADRTLGISPASGSGAGSMSSNDFNKLAALPSAVGDCFFYGFGLDGAATLAVNTTPADSKQYTTLAINASIVLSIPNYALECSTSLTLAAGAIIDASGIDGTADSTGGAAGLAQGHLANGVGPAGGGGGSTGANGSAGAAGTRNLGSAGGAGGNNGPRTGGAAGTLGAVTGLGLFDAHALQWRGGGNPATFSLPQGGGAGGGGAGGASGPGGGGGGQAGMMIVRAKAITVALGALFRAKGGRGCNRTTLDGSGGGGGGGGVVVVVCDSWTMPGGSNYADFFDVSGGAGGTSAGGLPGNAGSAGRVRLYVAGVLVYSLN